MRFSEHIPSQQRHALPVDFRQHVNDGVLSKAAAMFKGVKAAVDGMGEQYICGTAVGCFGTNGPLLMLSAAGENFLLSASISSFPLICCKVKGPGMAVWQAGSRNLEGVLRKERGAESG